MSHTEPDARMKILLAAKKLFARNGYDATTIRQISEEAGTNVALVSYYFGGKEKVFYALFETFFPLADIREFENERLDPVQGLKLVIEGVIRLREKDPELISMFQHEIHLMSCRVEVIRHHAFPVWRRLYEFIREGRDLGVFRIRSLDHAFMFVIGMLMLNKKFEYFAPLLKEGKQPVERLIEDTTEFVLRGLGCKEALSG